MEGLEISEGLHRGYQEKKKEKRAKTQKTLDIDNDIGSSRVSVVEKKKKKNTKTRIAEDIKYEKRSLKSEDNDI